MADGPAVEFARAGAATAAALLLHPHPDYGGNRFNVVVDALFRALPPAGVTAARFDFAGSDEQRARDDTRSALDSLAREAPALPLAVVGYSFGALVAVTLDDARVDRWVLVAAPFGPGSAPSMADDPRPKLVLACEHDQFCPPSTAAATVAGWPDTRFAVIPQADHFLFGHTGAVVDAVVEFLSPPAAP